MMRLSARPAASEKEERSGGGRSGPSLGWTIDSHAELAEALKTRSAAPVQRMNVTTSNDNDEPDDDDDDETEGLPEAAMAVLEHESVSVESRPTRGNERRTAINIAAFVREIASGQKDVHRASVVIALKEKIKAAAQEQSPDPDRLAALQWAFDYLAFPARARSGGGGSDDLEVTPQGNLLSVRGRPRFLPAALDLPNMKKGYARRHMIAWHTIRQSIANLINAVLKKDPGDQRLVQLRGAIEAAVPPEPPVKEEEKKPTFGRKTKKKEKKPPETELEKLAVAVERLLRVMNSNTRNLWPGPGYENSLINSYQSAMRTWSEQLAAMDDKQADAWRETMVAKIDTSAKTHRGAYATTLESLRDFLADKNITREGLLEQLPTLADNFEFDFPYDDDQRRAPQVDVQLVRIAGRFLDLADKEPDSPSADTLQQELLTLVGKFLGTEPINVNSNADPSIVISPMTPPPTTVSTATGIRPTVIAMLGTLLGGGDVDAAALTVYAGEPLAQAMKSYQAALEKLIHGIAGSHRDDASELENLLTNGVLP
ncbi:MAG TPA: hypothetical protein VHK90_18130, partial [Thermoanaerobaculia bacterium]|nr:hypothetical protein [Thermoanaerobaculia bacterium]